MLQQTQVVRVEAYYHRFLERYPTVEALAGVRAGHGAGGWAGLGYYRRAANLHRLAQRGRPGARRRHSARIRRCCERLPGVGRYTAGAVASFAYERATPAVDTNVARVIRRAFHPAARRTDRQVWEAGGGDHAAAGQGGVGLQPGHHGAGGAGVHGEGGALRRVPRPARLRDGTAGRTGRGAAAGAVTLSEARGAKLRV